MAAVERLFVAVNRAVVAAALALVFALVFTNVVGRYVFGNSLSWAEEAARHLMVFGAFAGAGLALREGRLVAIETLPDSLSPRAARVLRWAGVAIMAVFMVMLVWLGARFAIFGWPRETATTGMSRGIPYLAIPLGAGLFLIHLALFARRYVAHAFESGPEPDAGH